MRLTQVCRSPRVSPAECLTPPPSLGAARFVPFLFFFFNDTATTEIYTLSLHDALPIFQEHIDLRRHRPSRRRIRRAAERPERHQRARSEEHTSELQSRYNLVCRLL